MFKSRLLCILIMTIFCFVQIVEVYANFGRDSRFQSSLLAAMVAQEQGILIQSLKRGVIYISNQIAREKNKSIIGDKVKKVSVITIVAVLLGRLVLQVGSRFKTWVVEEFSKSFKNWRASLYH